MSERWPTSIIEDFEIEVGSKTHRGKRVVLRVSDTEIRQEIRYQSLRRVDPDVYRTRDADFMRAIAREIMWRLVAQSKAEAAHPQAEVEARSRTERRRPVPRRRGRQPPGPTA
jgi:hypothetical protein